MINTVFIFKIYRLHSRLFRSNKILIYIISHIAHLRKVKRKIIPHEDKRLFIWLSVLDTTRFTGDNYMMNKFFQTKCFYLCSLSLRSAIGDCYPLYNGKNLLSSLNVSSLVFLSSTSSSYLSSIKILFPI